VQRHAQWCRPLPGTNLIWPRTALPSLEVSLAPGRHVLACAVYASEQPGNGDVTLLSRALAALVPGAIDSLR
jgi:hypothetical protein